MRDLHSKTRCSAPKEQYLRLSLWSPLSLSVSHSLPLTLALLSLSLTLVHSCSLALCLYPCCWLLLSLLCVLIAAQMLTLGLFLHFSHYPLVKAGALCLLVCC